MIPIGMTSCKEGGAPFFFLIFPRRDLRSIMRGEKCLRSPPIQLKKISKCKRLLQFPFCVDSATKRKWSQIIWNCFQSPLESPPSSLLFSFFYYCHRLSATLDVFHQPKRTLKSVICGIISASNEIFISFFVAAVVYVPSSALCQTGTAIAPA